MDLIAPNPIIMRTGFIQLGVLVIMLAIAAMKKTAPDHGLLFWMKLNSPLVSIVWCEAWALASFVFFRPSPVIDEYFVVGIWMAGGSALVSSVVKDIGDGSVKATGVADVREMRAKNDDAGGVGG